MEAVQYATKGYPNMLPEYLKMFKNEAQEIPDLAHSVKEELLSIMKQYITLVVQHTGEERTMRKAEITILTALYAIVLAVGSMFIEKEYGITIEIKKIVQVQEIDTEK